MMVVKKIKETSSLLDDLFMFFLITYDLLLVTIIL